MDFLVALVSFTVNWFLDRIAAHIIDFILSFT